MAVASRGEETKPKSLGGQNTLQNPPVHRHFPTPPEREDKYARLGAGRGEGAAGVSCGRTPVPSPGGASGRAGSRTTGSSSSSKPGLHGATQRPNSFPGSCRPGASPLSPLEGAPRPPFGGVAPGLPPADPRSPLLLHKHSGGSVGRHPLPGSCLLAG